MTGKITKEELKNKSTTELKLMLAAGYKGEDNNLIMQEYIERKKNIKRY